MTLTLEVSPETVHRVEQAKSQGANMDTLLYMALEQWHGIMESKDAFAPHLLAPVSLHFLNNEIGKHYCLSAHLYLKKWKSAKILLAPLAGKYEGDAWDELLTEIEKNRQQETEANSEGK